MHKRQSHWPALTYYHPCFDFSESIRANPYNVINIHEPSSFFILSAFYIVISGIIPEPILPIRRIPCSQRCFNFSFVFNFGQRFWKHEWSFLLMWCAVTLSTNQPNHVTECHPVSCSFLKKKKRELIRAAEEILFLERFLRVRFETEWNMDKRISSIHSYLVILITKVISSYNAKLS